MRAVRYCFFFFVLCLAVTPSYAQWAVFDASNLAEPSRVQAASASVHHSEPDPRSDQSSPTTSHHYMSRMPQNLAQRYKSQFAMWTNLNAPNTYGNTSAWVNALNTGLSQQSLAGYSAAVVQVNPYPQSGFGQLDTNTQATIQNQYATSDLAQGMTTGALYHPRPGSFTFRVTQSTNLKSRRRLILERPNPAIEMAVLAKVNAANLIQLHSQQDTNQLLSAGIQQQMVAQKQAIDAQNRTMNQTIYFLARTSRARCRRSITA